MSGPASCPRSAIVELRAHGLQPLMRDSIGAAAPADDQPPLFQLLEHGHRTIGQHIAFTREAGDLDDPSALAIVAMFMVVPDVPALGEYV